MKKDRIGLALGSGASRGWSHIGVIKALVSEGIEPDVVAGTSVGAMIGAAYLAGNLDKLEDWVRNSTRKDVLQFFNIGFSTSGFVDSDRLSEFLTTQVVSPDTNIDDFDRPFAAIATDLGNGREVWFTEGNVVNAIRASMALPGLFPVVRDEERRLVDGGLVNPVPVSVCHAIGADIVIAVNLNADLVGKHSRKKSVSHAEKAPSAESKQNDEDDGGGFLKRVKRTAKDYSESIFSSDDDELGLFDIVASSINIFQDRITRSRMAGDPPDVLISPKLSHIGMLDFHRAPEAIAEGEEVAKKALQEIRRLTGRE